MILDQIKAMLSMKLMKAKRTYKIINQKLNAGLPLAVRFKLPFTVMVPLRFAVAGLGLSLYSSLTLWFLQDLDTISVIVDYIFIFSAQTPGKKALHLSTTWISTTVLSQP